MSAKETTERQAMLRRWSELEPERCQLVGRVPFLMIAPLERPAYCYADLSADIWVLLGALIEATTARGWSVEMVITPHSTRVNLDGRPVWRDAPADAVLSVYIQALEAATK